MLRKFLVEIRKRLNADTKKFFVFLGSGVVLLTVIAVLMDIFLPFNGLYNVLRALLLIPLALGLFSLFYAVSILAHRYKVANDPHWVPYRLRFSPLWRRRIAIVIGALLLVVMYGNTNHAGYTFTSSLIAVAVIALLAFMRTTRDEMMREELEIPDSRDINYKKRLADRQEQRRIEEAEAKAKAEAKKNKKSTA